MSSSVTLSIATNAVIAISKGIGFAITGSPTLFAETVHSVADVLNQVLLKVGEVRARRGPSQEHPFGHFQEKYFWALVSAVSVFFIGCGINLYHGWHSLQNPEVIEPFSLLVIGLLLFALALETWTFITAWREIGGWRGVRDNVNNTTVLAVLLEDAVALIGIVLALAVGFIGRIFGPHPEFDAWIAIGVGVLLGVMALFLAAVNRKVLIDSTDPLIDRAATRFLEARGIDAKVRSLVMDETRVMVFARVREDLPGAEGIAAELTDAVGRDTGKTIGGVFWQFGHTSLAKVPAHG